MNPKPPIAVVGMAGLFPGALDLDTFWQNIVSKIDTTDDIPEHRWIVDADTMVCPDPMPDKAYSKRACLINDFRFDPTEIDLDADLLKALDPLHQMVLHAGRDALKSCANALPNRQHTGVVLAAIALPTDASSAVSRKLFGYALAENMLGAAIRTAGKNLSLSRAECLAAKVTSLPAAILAEGLGLGGGSYTLDAACASSLYAVKLACDELHAGRADAMLAGGVSRPDCLYTQVGFSQLKALSPSGRCAPFDASADGLVVGEGVGILVLKRLDDAIEDNDHIHALIPGIGLSNDMRGNLLAPDSEGQLRAMQSAYANAGWSPLDVDLIECHGAGTPVGDAVELQSLRRLWGESGWTQQQCAIGSVKSMIGHLLTAAGAAGMIKTILALKNKMLPPSLKFVEAPAQSSLVDSPFRVQTEPDQWSSRTPGMPLRAAVSAFGFGGINSQLLFEEWRPDLHSRPGKRKEASFSTGERPFSIATASNPTVPVAIIGMATAFGRLASLRAFQETIFTGGSAIVNRPSERWSGCDHAADSMLNGRAQWGGFMDRLSILLGEFHIPPKEIPDMLPQHLLMLKIAIDAMKDASLPLRADRPRMGAVVGIDFDFEATNFHLRWNLHHMVREWEQNVHRRSNRRGDEHGVNGQTPQQDLFCPPLTATRTLGALAGIIASRIARELRFGGPSFVVSNEAASGLRALEIGMRLLQQNEVEAMLVGAVDCCGDVRSVVTNNGLRPFTSRRDVRPLDHSADGSLPGEGAAAVIIKRLDRAVNDGDRIYAVIKGIGSAGGRGVIDTGAPSKHAHLLSLQRSFQDADATPDSISLFEMHGSGNAAEDRVEGEAMVQFFAHCRQRCAVGSTKPTIGHAGAASGLASLVKTSLCLYHEILPPLTNFVKPGNRAWKESCFHMPALPQYWLRDRKNGPRRACVGSITADGNATHVILDGFEYSSYDQIPQTVQQERKRPLGAEPLGLFVVEGDSKTALTGGLDDLLRHVTPFRSRERSSPLDSMTADSRGSIDAAARAWYAKNPLNSSKPYAVAIVADHCHPLEKSIVDAKAAVSSDTLRRINASGGVAYSPSPVGPKGDVAFVFPGSGNHHVGMGRRLGVLWPDILRAMDFATDYLKTQLIPDCFVPWRRSWESGWEKDAYDRIISDPLHSIFGQVVHGSVVANIMRVFAVKASAVIGYSLGESAGLFAMGAWPDRGQMLTRIMATDLFATELAGPCNAARKAWKVPAGEAFDWCVVVINRTADQVRHVIQKWPYARLLIVNTPDQCVVGGRKHHVTAVIKDLGCDAVFLDGVVTVHCDAAEPASDAYKKLHLFPTAPPDGVRFYSCAKGRSYRVNRESAANSMLQQAVSGFNFVTLIEQAYTDGVRVFVELGPHSSCTAMISRILGGRSHLAVSACHRGEDDYLTILKCLATLIAERVGVDLDALYGDAAYAASSGNGRKAAAKDQITLTIGNNASVPFRRPSPQQMPDMAGTQAAQKPAPDHDAAMSTDRRQYSELMDAIIKNTQATAEAHQTFLEFSEQWSKGFEKTFAMQLELIEQALSDRDHINPVSPFLRHVEKRPLPEDLATIDNAVAPAVDDKIHAAGPAFDRQMCLEFAVGSVAKVLGPEFAVVDTYPVRVRLPDEPLMLVDRILTVEGEKCSLGSGRIVTEHDVLPGAWYLDGGRAPVCISVEAGQADLFLCAYLGIDHAVQGKRSYRLLDATVTFHRGLPRPGDVLRYEIDIDHFVRQGDTYLFFFRFEGFIENQPLISMFNGCAGFFTEQEVKNSGGIIFTAEDARAQTGKRPSDWVCPVTMVAENYDHDMIDALRQGDLARCFGPLFQGVEIHESLRLPGGRMKLIHRVQKLDPEGGRFGLGVIRAEADIHPDDWFLTCHFMDDMVMPGTLMYECCAHTLRIFLQRMGWVTAKPDVSYEPVTGVESVLKCRGPVTPKTKQVLYEVEIKEIGYAPEPYVIADALMYADGQRIVSFKDMSMKMSGITRTEIESMWKQTLNSSSQNTTPFAASPEATTTPLFDRDKILAFATGKPSQAFGDHYKIFDQERFLARLPAPPYSFIDRIVTAEPEPWVLKPNGWIEAAFDVTPDAWFFNADRTSFMPYCILLEAALQPCGWLAAYMGSALRSEGDLKFRNLGGSAMLTRPVRKKAQSLTLRARMTKASEAAEMIIEHFDFQVLEGADMVYSGDTYFGFFSPQALSRQVGIGDAEKNAYQPTSDELRRSRSFTFEHQPPRYPGDPEQAPAAGLPMPATALRMLDRISVFVPDGGPFGLGFIRGIKIVNPDEWFFKAHFYQDPVWPGSLGIESFLQLVRFAAINRWEHLVDTHTFQLMGGEPHNWTYRGQVVPTHEKVTVEAVITSVSDAPIPTMCADGWLKVDGRYIYQMNNFGLQLVPLDRT